MKKNLIKTLVVAFVLLVSATVASAQVPNKAFEDNMRVVDSVQVGSVWQPVFAIYSGDLDQDGQITIYDISQMYTDFEAALYGYLVSDLDGDGQITIYDISLLTTHFEDPNGIYLRRPY